METMPPKATASQDGPFSPSSRFVCPQPVRVCILGASFQKDNLAVSSILSGTIKVILSTYRDVEISVLDGTVAPGWMDVVQEGTKTEVKCLRIDFSARLSTENNIWTMLIGSLVSRLPRSQRIHDGLTTHHSCLRSIEAADIVVSLSGGDRFTDSYGVTRFLSAALPQLLVLLLRRPLVFLPQTLGPFQKRLTKIIARSILARARLVFSRDHESITELRSGLGVDHDRFEVGNDMSFVVEPHIVEKQVPLWLQNRHENTPLVGLNVSGLLYGGGLSANNALHLKADYRQLIYNIIEHFIMTYQADIVFVPFIFGANADGQCDVMAGRRIFRGVRHKLYNNLRFIDGVFDENEMKALIGKCDFFIGSRVEACIAAMSQCIPSIALAYSRRSGAVFGSIGLEGLAIDMETCDEKSIVERLDEAYRHREALRAQLGSKIPSLQAFVMDLFDRLNLGHGAQ